MTPMCLSGASAAAALTLVMAQWACMPPQAAAPPGAPGRSAAAEPAAARAKTLAEASAACDRVQANREIPVSCTTEYVDDVPSMIVGFRSGEEAEQWLGAFAQHIGEPFCDAANRNGREARVYMAVGTGTAQRARMWSCELGKWSDWFSTTPEAPERRAGPEQRPAQQQTPVTIADAISACNAVQANEAVPVSCRTEYVNGMPAMIVGFPSSSAAESYMEQVAEKVAGPFCSAANRANRHASLFITLANAQARHFDCEQQKWSEWFELSEPTEPPRRDRL
jgi:hypothetical protein